MSYGGLVSGCPIFAGLHEHAGVGVPGFGGVMHRRFDAGCLAVAVLALVAGGLAAPSAVSASAAPDVEITSVDAFNPTDFDTIPGYLQVAISITYACLSGDTATIDGQYGPASQSVDLSGICDDTTHTAIAYARVPDAYGVDPIEADVTYTAGVTLNEMLGGAATSGPVTATASGTEYLPAITDVFPPYYFRVRRSPSHPASQILVTWDPPLTTGGHTLTGYDIRNTEIGLHADLGPTAAHYVVKHLKSGHTYGFAMSAIAGNDNESTTTRSVTTAHKIHRDVTLSTHHHHVKVGHVVKLSGTVSPAGPGRISLELREDGHWKTIARLHLHHGAFHRHLHANATITARVVAVGTPDFTRSVSPTVTVAVG
jgi:hypothetical protein